MKPKKLWPSLCAGALLLGGTAPAQTVGSDSWAATDALGRKVRDYKEAGAKKPDKFVAISLKTTSTFPPANRADNWSATSCSRKSTCRKTASGTGSIGRISIATRCQENLKAA